MKHKGCTGYMVDERNSDLFAQFGRLLKLYHWAIPMSELYEELAKRTKAKRFYVTPSRAIIAIRTLNCGCGKYVTEKREMYLEIERRANVLVKSKGCPMEEAIGIAVEQEAPSFYLSPKTAKNILTNMVRGGDGRQLDKRYI